MIKSLLRHKGDPAFAWTAMIITIMYLHTLHGCVSGLIDGERRGFYNWYVTILMAFMVAFMYFCAMIERTRVRLNGRDY